jgi:hypothetical protein
VRIEPTCRQLVYKTLKIHRFDRALDLPCEALGYEIAEPPLVSDSPAVAMFRTSMRPELRDG